MHNALTNGFTAAVTHEYKSTNIVPLLIRLSHVKIYPQVTVHTKRPPFWDLVTPCTPPAIKSKNTLLEPHNAS